ncbi:hypothetical protein [uncultured Bradyrhizobium sp.]|uniref:plasmid mobilization protein n=1 Tax=uncultured Bradyrhizobium sp. TaxID=199684 RepID=UPI0035CC6229
MDTTSGRQRRYRITIRVSASERLGLDEAARRAGITLSAYARHALLGAKPLRAARRPSVEAALMVGLLDRLGGIASTMRALACMLNARTGETMPVLERDLSRSLIALRALRPQLLAALGKRRVR